MNDLLTLTDVADRMQLSRRTIERAVSDGRLRVVRVGRSVRVKPAELEAFIRACERRGRAA